MQNTEGAGRIGDHSLLPLFPIVSVVSATIMTPQLDTAQHILIKTLLKEEFETKLIASKASCSVRAVQRIRLKRQQLEMPTPKNKPRRPS